MQTESIYLAVDLGASSGRVMAARHRGDALSLEEIHRFENGPELREDGYRWNFNAIMNEIETGLSRAVDLFGDRIRSIGVDTWGVDYGLLDADGHLIEDPFAYRDARTDGMMEEAYRRMPKESLYAITGIQTLPFNTLFQLLSEVTAKREAFQKASRLLFIPDLIHFRLCGRAANEYTIASTSQLLDAQSRDWSAEVLEAMDIPPHLFSKPVMPGTILGEWKNGIQVVAVGGHDTASAVASVPALYEGFAYLSSGTWSLLGIERADPLLDAASAALDFTNEGGINHTLRVLKNIGGLWLIQECRRTWAEQGQELSFSEIAKAAEEAEPFQALVHPDAPSFAAPGDMPARLRSLCAKTGQDLPNTVGAIARCVFESLAMRYRDVLDMLEQISGNPISTLHIVGGGTQNKLLNQFAANASGRSVIAGPVEATALGNALVQMMADGSLQSLREGRSLIQTAFPQETYIPTQVEAWDTAYQHYRKVSAS